MINSMFGGEILDTLIIGSGPSGLSAAVNAKARNLKAMLIDIREPASKVRSHPEVTNYLGFPRASGNDLANHFSQHFAGTGYEFKKERVLKIMPMDDSFMVSTDKGSVFQSRTVILAVGVSQKQVLPGEEEFLGRGVSYCVTCDGALFRGKDIVVIGYTPEGEEEANVLAEFARRVVYISTYGAAKTIHKAVELLHDKPQAIVGDTRARVLQTSAGELKADGIFIIREAVPIGTLLEGISLEDDFIKVDRSMSTNIPGVFAAGDCTGAPFQIAKSVGEGQIAGLNAAKYVYKSRTKES